MNGMQTAQIIHNASAPQRLSRYGIVNSYLIRDLDGLTAIDTGLPGLHRTILARAAELGAPLTRIILTHAHSDHTGSLDAIKSATPELEVVTSVREAPLFKGNKSLLAGEPHSRVRGVLPAVKAKITTTVVDGERIGALEIIATPGHTPGHISLLDTRDGTLYAGDVFANIGGLATSAAINPRFPLPGLLTWNRDLALHSAERLRRLRPARLAPGHGRPIDNPVAEMRTAINQAARRH